MKKLLLVIGLGIGAFVAANQSDIRRYIKMRTM